MNPWSRWGWVLTGVWLVFLVYPVTSVLATRHGALVKALGIADVVVFAVAFTVGCRRGWARLLRHHLDRAALVPLAVLLGCVVVLAGIVGIDAVSIAPFLVSFCTFVLPPQPAVVAVTAVWAVAVGVPMWTARTGEWTGLWFILGVVTVSTMVSRVATDRGNEYDRTMEALRLAEERERVARDVHDVLGHSLTVVAVKTELAERLLDVDVERARAELAEVRALTRTALAEIRETVGGLRVASLADEVDGARRALTGAGITPVLPEDLTVVDPRHTTVLAWVLREAVTNVVRHSGATRCVVTLAPAGLVVEDDGRGLRGRREGNGLRGLRERVAGVGGTVTLAPGEDGRGTRLEVTV